MLLADICELLAWLKEYTKKRLIYSENLNENEYADQ